MRGETGPKGDKGSQGLSGINVRSLDWFLLLYLKYFNLMLI